MDGIIPSNPLAHLEEPDKSGVIRKFLLVIGNIFGAMIDPATAAVVRVNSTGKLGTVASSRRFKHDIKPMDDASKAILALKPVTFHYRSDAKNTPCFGLVAEEVAEMNPDLVVRNENGEIYTVRYDAVNAMLLNEFLKEHRKVQEQRSDDCAAKEGFPRNRRATCYATRRTGSANSKGERPA